MGDTNDSLLIKNSLTKKPYRQLFADENNELFQTLMKDPLSWAIYTVCALRARRTHVPSPEGLEQGEFWLSEMEYAKFGLKQSQRGQISRRLAMFQKRFKLISKTGKKIGNEKANIYRMESNQLININSEIENEVENKQGTNRERIETNKNDIACLAAIEKIKTKKQVRQEQGKWQYFTKTKGWVNISDPIAFWKKIKNKPITYSSDLHPNYPDEIIYPNITAQRLEEQNDI